ARLYRAADEDAESAGRGRTARHYDGAVVADVGAEARDAVGRGRGRAGGRQGPRGEPTFPRGVEARGAARPVGGGRDVRGRDDAGGIAAGDRAAVDDPGGDAETGGRRPVGRGVVCGTQG